MGDHRFDLVLNLEQYGIKCKRKLSLNYHQDSISEIRETVEEMFEEIRIKENKRKKCRSCGTIQ